MNGLASLIALEILKEQNESLKTSDIFNFIESILVHCIIKELYDSIMNLTDEEISLILISSEYARIHRRS